MNGFEARQYVTDSLRKSGATCKIDEYQSDKVNIIVTWRFTTWRILVIPQKIKTDTIAITENYDVKRLKATSGRNRQKAVIAYVYPDCDILYYDIAKGNKIRPRCLVRHKTTTIIE